MLDINLNCVHLQREIYGFLMGMNTDGQSCYRLNGEGQTICNKTNLKGDEERF